MFVLLVLLLTILFEGAWGFLCDCICNLALAAVTPSAANCVAASMATLVAPALAVIC